MTKHGQVLVPPQEKEQADALAQAFAGSYVSDLMRLSRIMDLLPCFVALLDKEHRIIFHNKAFEQFFGPPAGRLCYQAMRGLAKACAFCPPMTLLKGKGSNVMEWVRPESKQAFRVHSFRFDESPGGPFVLQTGFNITANIRVQQALDLSEQSYRAITDNLSIGVALIDPQLRIKAGNIRLSQWFAEGFRLDRNVCELLCCCTTGKDVRSGMDALGSGIRLAPPGASSQAEAKKKARPAADKKKEQQGEAKAALSAPRIEAAANQACAAHMNCPDCPFLAALEDGNSHERELSVTFQDGVERSVRLITCPVKPGKLQGNKGRVRALIMMLEDITTRLKVNKQLQRARKIEAMSTLTGGIAHEINQPLSALHLYASGLQMLLEKQEPLPPETTQERLGLIMREADKIRSIISHMRALVMQEGKVPLNGVSLAKAVQAVLAIMHSQLQSHEVQITVDIPADLPPVRSNALQMEQVLVNLMANALHAMDSKRIFRIRKEGGTIISARRIKISAALLDNGSRVRLEVADSGPGLPPGSERIFDPFFTTKERHQGMGLGLSIVHGLISLWGAEISAISRHPELGGAAFHVDLHAMEQDEAPPRESGDVPMLGIGMDMELQQGSMEDALDEDAVFVISGAADSYPEQGDDFEHGPDALHDFVQEMRQDIIMHNPALPPQPRKSGQTADKARRPESSDATADKARRPESPDATADKDAARSQTKERAREKSRSPKEIPLSLEGTVRGATRRRNKAPAGEAADNGTQNSKKRS
ncbi:PAS domain-containing protein [Desulfovibrio sp. OttesenSCG-928-A18]|nr:PAS domain-containing protein [Desulfovibrio sp. OttesenSCG-928-A18]